MTHSSFPVGFPRPDQLAAHCKPVSEAIAAGKFDDLKAKFEAAMEDMVFPSGVIGEVNHQLTGTTYKIETVEEKDIDELPTATSVTTDTTVRVLNGTSECCRFTIRWSHMPFRH
jgi:hypothetical protein